MTMTDEGRNKKEGGGAGVMVEVIGSGEWNLEENNPQGTSVRLNHWCHKVA